MHLLSSSIRSRFGRCVVSLLATLATLSFLTAQGQSTKGDSAKIAWRIESRVEHRFRLDYESSQRLEILDSRGRSLTPAPEFDRPRAISFEGRLKWTRARASLARGVLVVEKIHSLRLGEFQGEAVEKAGWSVDIALKPSPPAVELHWKKKAIRHLTVYAGKDLARAKEISALLEEALLELTRFLGSTSAKPIARSGQKWEVRNLLYPLDRPTHNPYQIEAKVELEYMDRVTQARPDGSDREVAHIEGAIRQNVPQAPAGVRRHKGLFPGKVVWRHDLQRGFPIYLEAIKLARIPVADLQLPIVKTLTHTYRLRVGDPEAFPEENDE